MIKSVKDLKVYQKSYTLADEVNAMIYSLMNKWKTIETRSEEKK